MRWLIEPYWVISVDDKVWSVDIVAFENHFKNFWLMHGTLFHELDDLVLLGHGVVYIMI